jgi:hypothetical protein
VTAMEMAMANGYERVPVVTANGMAVDWQPKSFVFRLYPTSYSTLIVKSYSMDSI